MEEGVGLVEGREYACGALGGGGSGPGTRMTIGGGWRIIGSTGVSLGAGRWRKEAGVPMRREALSEMGPAQLV